MNSGWMCPACRRVFAPTIQFCPPCTEAAASHEAFLYKQFEEHQRILARLDSIEDRLKAVDRRNSHHETLGG